jgi:hypothetical protein
MAGKEELPEELDPKANPRRRGMRGFCMVGRDASKALWESQLRWAPKEDRHHEFQKVYVLLLHPCVCVCVSVSVRVHEQRLCERVDDAQLHWTLTARVWGWRIHAHRLTQAGLNQWLDCTPLPRRSTSTHSSGECCLVRSTATQRTAWRLIARSRCVSGAGVCTARAKVYVDDAGMGFTLQPEGGWPRAILASADTSLTSGSRRRRHQTPDAAEHSRPHTQPTPRPVSQVTTRPSPSPGLGRHRNRSSLFGGLC